MKKKEFKPDFIQIPYQLVRDKDLSPMDKLVYGAIYFFSRMRGESCFASNTVLAEILDSTGNTVSRSLQKLEEKRYIVLNYEDEKKKKRSEIIPLVRMGRTLVINKSKVIPNGITDGQNDVIPNGITVMPGGITGYSKQNNPEKSQKDTQKDEIVAQESQNNDSKSENGVIPFGIEIYNSRIVKEKNHKESFFGPSDQGDLSDGQKDFLPISFQEKVKHYETGEKSIPAQMVNEAIALFLPLFPLQFVGKEEPFAIPATRKMIKRVLLMYTMDQLKELLNKYLSQKEEKFIPQAMNIYAFCSKIEVIETYFKKNGGLWAQRSISTPEQRADSDEIMRKKMEADREQQRKDKEEWERTHSK